MSVQKSETKTISAMTLAVGLLGGCLLTLMSAFAGHEPEAILFRAFVGFGLFVIGAWTMNNFLRSILAENEDEEF